MGEFLRHSKKSSDNSPISDNQLQIRYDQILSTIFPGHLPKGLWFVDLGAPLTWSPVAEVMSMSQHDEEPHYVICYDHLATCNNEDL